MSPLPVSASLKVLAYKTYVQTAHRWIALFVVSNGLKNTLRFYKWRREDNASPWKVDLARFSVADLDLGLLASDAIELAQAYKVRLEWPSQVAR